MKLGMQREHNTHSSRRGCPKGYGDRRKSKYSSKYAEKDVQSQAFMVM